MPNVKDVRIGAPEQSTTGAIITKAAVTLNQAFEGDEYVSQDGLTLAPSMSTTEIKDWSGATVRKVLESFDGTLSWTMISTNEGAMKVAFGDAHVTKNAATATHGTQIQAAVGAHMPDAQSWVFLMKDGDARVVIVVPNGQVTEIGEVTFASNAAIGWQVTLSCYPDTNNECIYIMTDDGVVTGSTSTST